MKKKRLFVLLFVLLCAVFSLSVPASAAAKKKTVRIKLDEKTKMKSVTFVATEYTVTDVSIKILSVSGKGSGTGYWIPESTDEGKGSLFYNFNFSKIKKNAVFNAKCHSTFGILDFRLPAGIRKLDCQVTLKTSGKKLKSVKAGSYEEAAKEFNHLWFNARMKSMLQNMVLEHWMFPGKSNDYVSNPGYIKEISLLSNSNKDVVDVTLEGGVNGPASSIRYTIKKPGTAKVVFQMTSQFGDKIKSTYTIRGRKYENPFKSFKIGKKDLTSWFDQDYIITKENIKPLSGKIKIQTKSGWEIESCGYYPQPKRMYTEIKLGKKVTITKEDGALRLKLKDKKAKYMNEMNVEVRLS